MGVIWFYWLVPSAVMSMITIAITNPVIIVAILLLKVYTIDMHVKSETNHHTNNIVKFYIL